MSSTISYRLDLVLILLDTTTGQRVDQFDVDFSIKENPNLKFIRRADATYILINADRKDFSMEIVAKNYEPCQVSISYDELDNLVPMKVVFLIPSEKSPIRDMLISLEGKLSGLSEVSFVLPDRIIAQSSNYDPKKMLLNVFEKGYRLTMEGSPFGLINQSQKSYEVFEVEAQTTESQVKLKGPLEEEFLRNMPIARIIYGRVEPDGSYLLRIRDDGLNLKTYVRYVVEGEVRFKEIDFHDLAGVSLD